MNTMKTNKQSNEKPEIEMMNKASRNIVSYTLSSANAMLAIYFVFSGSDESLAQILLSYLGLSLAVVMPLVIMEWNRSKESVVALVAGAALTGTLFGIAFHFILINLTKMFGVI